MSLGIVIGGKYLQMQIDTKINSEIDCTFVDIQNVTEVVREFNDTNISNLTKIKTYCYCKNYLYNNDPIKTKNLVIGNVHLCQDWIVLYIQVNSLSIGIIIVIPIVNAILVLILKFLTKFERNKTISVEKMADIGKIFLMQMINTGLIILLVNTNLQSFKVNYPNFPIFTGKYKDMTPQWFLEIGSTIAFSLILNAFIPHLSILMQNCLTLCNRCLDSGCGCVGDGSTLDKKEYSLLYTGPEFLIDCRYSQVNYSL